MRKILLLGGILLSAALAWFSVSNYQSSLSIAEENLRGLALSLTAAIENFALHDPSLMSFRTLQTDDIAYFAVIDQKGLYRFHTNRDLIATPLQGALPLTTLKDAVTYGGRLTLRTGEKVFEYNAPLFLPGETLAIRLTLHTYRTDNVVRRARLNLIILLGLLASGWSLAIVIYRLSLREELHILQMARRESLAQLGEMGAMLAHEIRNPLAGIKGFAQLIENKPLDERNRGFAERIVAETRRLELLVSDLLEYARSERDSMERIDFCEVIAHTVAILCHEAKKFHINIITESPEGLMVDGNRDRLGQVLLNLGKNAIQAMPDGGTLEITAVSHNGNLTVKLIDNGIGISKEELSQIFEPFYTTKAKGTGLGLALCRKIVEDHGGKIVVDSTVGQGTAVSLTIPVMTKQKGRS